MTIFLREVHPTRKVLVRKVIVTSRHLHLLYLVTTYVIGTISSSLANHKQLIVAFTLTENEGFCFVCCFCFFLCLFYSVKNASTNLEDIPHIR